MKTELNGYLGGRTGVRCRSGSDSPHSRSPRAGPVTVLTPSSSFDREHWALLIDQFASIAIVTPVLVVETTKRSFAGRRVAIDVRASEATYS